MQDGRKAVWSIPYVCVAFFQSLKQNFIAYRSSKVSDCIFENHQLWQSGFSRMYSNSWCSRSFELEIINIGQSSHKMYSKNILNFQESTTILNARTKKFWKLIVCPSRCGSQIIVCTSRYGSQIELRCINFQSEQVEPVALFHDIWSSHNENSDFRKITQVKQPWICSIFKLVTTWGLCATSK